MNNMEVDLLEQFDEISEKFRHGTTEQRLQLAKAYLKGDIRIRDYDLGFEILKELDEEEILEAANFLGDCYYFGWGTESDAAEAFSFYSKASAENPRAQYNLAHCYEKGIGIETNPQKAFFWMNEAALNELSDAQFELGNYYKNGFGTKLDKAKALDWYIIAANHPKHPNLSARSAKEFLKAELSGCMIVSFETGKPMVGREISNYTPVKWRDGTKLTIKINSKKYNELLSKYKDEHK